MTLALRWRSPYFPPISLINPFSFTGPLVVYLGMKDVLRKIKEAEQSAEKRLTSAQTESSKIVADSTSALYRGNCRINTLQRQYF